MGSNIWRRLSSQFKGGHADRVVGYSVDKGSGTGSGHAGGGSKEGGAVGQKALEDPPQQADTPQLMPGQNTVNPVAFWWIYGVPEEKQGHEF